MTTRIKVAIGIAVVAILRPRRLGVGREPGQEPRAGHDREGREGAARLDGELQRARAGPRRKVDISSQVMGQIVTLAVVEGDHVKKGDLLLQIDKVQYDANAQATQAGLDALFAQRESDKFTREQAERDLDRTKKNFAANIESEQNLQKAQLALDSAKANERADERRIEQARANLLANKDSLKKTTITLADRRRRHGEARRGRARTRSSAR